MTASPIQLDSRIFHKRMRILSTHWKASKRLGTDALSEVDTLLIHVGIPNDTTVYQKSTALHFWLFGYEFPETILAIHLNGVSAITSPKKGAILEHLNSFHDKATEVTVYKRGKDVSEQSSLFASVLETMQNHGLKVGVLSKDKADSPMIADWLQYVKEQGGSALTMVDVSSAMSTLLAIKDEEEQGCVRTAAKCSQLLMSDYVVDQLLTIIDDEKQVAHDTLSEKIEGTILVPENPKKKMAVKFPADVHLDYLEMCYPPILQSGGQYALRPSASSNSDTIHFGTIVCALGVRFKSYCSNMGRTFLIAPTAAQETNYVFLVALQQHILAAMRPGVSLRQIYEQAVEYVREKRPDLTNHLVTNVGFGMGLEFRESDYVIHSKNEREFKQGMVFNVAVGFQDLVNEAATDERGKKYALFLADTVTIGKTETHILTDGLKRLEDVSFVFKYEEDGGGNRVEEDSKQVRSKKSRHLGDVDQEVTESGGGRVIKTRLRSQSGKTLIDTAALKKREVHQKALLTERIREGLAAASGLDGNSEAGSGKGGSAEAKLIESYRKEAFLPSSNDTKALKIYVDKRAESVLFPICGLAVPFHINTIKNVTKSDEGEFLYLRVNFQLPAKGSANAQQPATGTEPGLHYIRSLTFRSTDTYHLGQVYKELTDLRKLVSAKETEKKQMADLVQQESLIEIKPATHQGKRAIRLPDVYMRPALEGKRVPGDLEIHANGIRYRNMLKGDLKTDILFSNLKHLFFQPCDNELIILIHCHLKHPILIGKKKTKDVQFYREASDAIVDETVAGRGARGGMKRRPVYGDEDEIMQEQEERRRRAALNQEFKLFCERLAASDVSLNVDIPIRTLGFYGVPFRQNVLCQPTRDCLVHLTDPPFLVVPLADVEVASLERVLFSLKNFDLIFIMKDHTQPPQHIDAIPMSYLEPIKEWLDSCDVYYMTSNINFNWPNVLKTVREDPQGFYEMGGWRMIQANPDSPPSDASEDDSDEGDSVYEEPEEDDDGEGGGSGQSDESDASLASDDEDEDYDSEASDEDDEDASEEDEEEDEDAMDWDELEEKAKRDEIAQRKRK